MQFRHDINGLRAIAVIAVVLFHFNESWLPGGFAGVDVFFVISGFLMTGIVFRGLELENFSIIKFYVARAKRIIPALAVLCIVLMFLGFFYLLPMDYKALGKHVASSIGFLSNVIYWRESGYFDSASHEKWLLHTWSLSVEWQFYMIYPVVIVSMRKLMNTNTIKVMVILATVLSFGFSIVATYKWPNSAYFLLPTRAWEMLIGGVAYLYPLSIKDSRKKYLELTSLALIVGSYFLISKESSWPGYLAIFPVLGAYLIIQAQRSHSLITGNKLFQLLGKWSYSIYLWHWPIVVVAYKLDLDSHLDLVLCILLSVCLGGLSYNLIETRITAFKHRLFNAVVYLSLLVLPVVAYKVDKPVSQAYEKLVYTAVPSPKRGDCHVEAYDETFEGCNYPKEERVTWASLGDSHVVELSYALSKKLYIEKRESLSHHSFSACKPSFGMDESFSTCAQWTNQTVKRIIESNDIQNVLVGYRYGQHLHGDHANTYPNMPSNVKLDEISQILKSLDNMILELARSKERVLVLLPIPELPKSINSILAAKYILGDVPTFVSGTNKSWYLRRNDLIISHFRETKYPRNVEFIDPASVLCDAQKCNAIIDGFSMYFDDDHPSVEGASRIVNLIDFE